MATNADLLISELNKINKKDLINILVQQKIPNNLVLNKTVSDFFNSLGILCDNSAKLDENECNTDTEVINICEKINCIRHSVQVEFLRNESSLLKKIIVVLENRINDQQVIINLQNDNKNLSYNNKNKCDSAVSPSISKHRHSSHKEEEPLIDNKIDRNRTLSSLSTARSMEGSSLSNPSRAQQIRKRNTPTKQPKQNKSTFTLSQVNTAVSQAKNALSPFAKPERRRKPIIGCCNQSTVKALANFGYLHVYRLNPGTTAEDLSVHLKNTAPDINFKCDSLNSTEKSSSFKVSFPMDKVSCVYDPNIWPLGACVRRYIFKKNKNADINFQQEGLRVQQK